MNSPPLEWREHIVRKKYIVYKIEDIGYKNRPEISIGQLIITVNKVRNPICKSEFDKFDSFVRPGKNEESKCARTKYICEE